MQSEELENNHTAEVSPATEMTVSACKESPPNIQSEFEDFHYSNDGIKAEFEIEKLLPESPQSTETIEDETPERSSSEGKPEKNDNTNESIRQWLQRITQMQNEIQKKLNIEHSMSSPNHSFSEFPVRSSNNQTQNANRVVKYQDLPYMGEMTLDNSKPRRGRKPKKADICHLIYKNYGTIFPGTPDSKKLGENPKKLPVEKPHKEATQEPYNRSDVQNRIISSLLEKRLTQESKRHQETKSKKKAQDQNEPLNLCIRDLNQLKIRLLRKHENVYKTDPVLDIKCEPASDDEVEFVHETPSPSAQKTPDLKIPGLTPEEFTAAFLDSSKIPENGTAPGGYVYWPNAGVFIHPAALQQHLMYYQKMAANSNYTLPSHSPRPPPDPQLGSDLRKLAPKLRPKKQNSTEETESKTEQKTKRNAPAPAEKSPTKRKRSAIFIPPIPAENQTNPATEVSICKFKFTGGAKPSLQEKKMLSVDSGGNFRYYSGTGDKSMRGYEFFPRETLQQQINNAQGSSTGAFLQASGEKIFPPTVDFAAKQGHPEFMIPSEVSSSGQISDLGRGHKKRKSRKSLQREKLEQTFKEKGFLIQTQQLESAEGATYCKFRQLRKFTRYLFRSWKDYLPGNVRELQEGEEEEQEDLTRLPANRLSPNDIKAPI